MRPFWLKPGLQRLQRAHSWLKPVVAVLTLLSGRDWVRGQLTGGGVEAIVGVFAIDQPTGQLTC